MTNPRNYLARYIHLRLWVIPEINLAIYLIPKIACTSMKKALRPILTIKRPQAERVDLSGYVTAIPVRSPWERVRSVYAGKVLRDSIKPALLVYMGATPFMEFPKFLEIIMRTPLEARDKHVLPQHLLYNSPYWTGPDIVLRFEKIGNEWNRLRGVVPQLPVLPHHNNNNGFRPDWTRETVEMAAEIYSEDIELLKYEAPNV